MPYSLVSAGSLGFDLTRLPGGTGVAEVLLDALACAGRARRPRRRPPRSRRARALVRRRSGPSRTCPPRRPCGSPHLPSGWPADGDLTGSRDLLTRLSRARRSVTSAPSTGCCATTCSPGPGGRRTASGCSRGAHEGRRRAGGRRGVGVRLAVARPRDAPRAGAPYLSARPPARAEEDPTPVRPSCATCRAGTPTTARRGAPPSTWRGRTPPGGPESMHDASWAVHLSGRLRAAAEAQLCGVISFGLAGLRPRDAAYGSWNALSGVLQALTVADLLPDAHRDVLLRPLARGARRTAPLSRPTQQLLPVDLRLLRAAPAGGRRAGVVQRPGRDPQPPRCLHGSTRRAGVPRRAGPWQPRSPGRPPCRDAAVMRAVNARRVSPQLRWLLRPADRQMQRRPPRAARERGGGTCHAFACWWSTTRSSSDGWSATSCGGPRHRGRRHRAERPARADQARPARARPGDDGHRDAGDGRHRGGPRDPRRRHAGCRSSCSAR